MSDYAMAEGRFVLPAGWQDQTVHIFAAQAAGAAGPPECSVVIHRDPPAAGENLAAYVARQIAQSETSLPGMRVLRQGRVALGGLPARQVDYRWTSEQGPLRQRQLFSNALEELLTSIAR